MKLPLNPLLIPVVAGLLLLSAGRGLAASDERFGVMTHFAQGWDPAWTAVAKEAGFTQVRDELYWKEVEPEKGKFSFPAAYDRYLAALKQDQISPLIVLSFENPAYDGGATPYTPEGFDGYARYAVEVLRHCGPQVKAVEIWNEYNGTFNHGPASNDRAKTYLAMLRAAYAAIKRERPDVTVVGGATSEIPLPYWEKLLAGGALDSMDVLSIHPYRYGTPPEGIEDDVAALQRLVKKYDPAGKKPIWVTEIGWYLKPAKAPGDLVIDEAVQAKFLVRGEALLLSAGVERVYWYLLRDYEDFTMGLAHDDPTRTHKPAFAAQATMIRQLRDARFVRREPTPADLYSLVFQRPDGKEVRVLWSLTPRPLKLKGRNAAVNLSGQPVTLGAGFTLDDSPVFVTGTLHGLPPAPPEHGKILADSARDFGNTQGEGWTYGAFRGGDKTFLPLPKYELTDWQAAWTGDFPYLAVTATGQHPSSENNQPVASVRRWRSNYEGRVRITGSFRCGTEGDGVGVSFAVDGVVRFRALLGGGVGVVKTFDEVETVHPGTTLDFAVDPGPAANMDFDATTVSVVIRTEP